MEIFMRNIPFNWGELDVKGALAVHLHGPKFPGIKPNFKVSLHPVKRGKRFKFGTFTLVDPRIAIRFLEIYGGNDPLELITMDQSRIDFQQSKDSANENVLDDLARSPWIDPSEERKRIKRNETLYSDSSRLPLKLVQFGWMCRDGVFSIEGEAYHHPSFFCFDPERKEAHITFLPKRYSPNTYVIAIRQQSILSTSAHASMDNQAVIHLQLEIPPTFLRRGPNDRQYYRMSSLPFPSFHPRATPYISVSVRLVLVSQKDLRKFFRLANLADLHRAQNHIIRTEYRKLFTDDELDRVEKGILSFEWRVAFQLESLLRNMDIDTTELLGLLPRVDELVNSYGSLYVADLLKTFSKRVMKLGNSTSPLLVDEALCQTFHAMVTPTTILLTGPFPERSNRVIRRYGKRNEDNFLRVEFREEDGLQYRLDRDVNGRASLRHRISPILKEKIVIAGRSFDFLAYSQSALREHSVWFCRPFVDSDLGEVDAARIIQDLGTFDNLSYDKELINCPARYAARLSQAFTATEAATFRVEEPQIRKDIKTNDKQYIFTDGCGCMSEDFAREIWQTMHPKGRDSEEDFPRAYQIRYAGSKGMLSVDYKLKGSRSFAVRPSMIKFDAPEAKEIEIVRGIKNPTPYYFNRPLIMLLEGLGVNYDVLQHFQDKAVAKTQDATRALQDAIILLENHGLGSSFRLASTMQNIIKLGIDALQSDAFYGRLLRVAVYHALRDLKNNARIPIPDAWTLVGVADEHNFLGKNEIFACIKKSDGEMIYLEGHVLVSRSPCIHPGDVQVVSAIGKPPKGSCFEVQSLQNTVVFSTKGIRPIPSCLGGGDLDGDIYNLLPLAVHKSLTPLRYFKPGKYTSGERKCLDKPSTMKDVADFVMEYIISDVIGLVANRWLVIADQSQFGIQDRVCLRLAQLHSDAVDYPKTGNPVSVAEIPKLKFPLPDWSAPETVDPDPVNYYPSQSAVGRLSRAIDLRQHESSLPGHAPCDVSADSMVSTMNPRLVEAVRERISGYIDDLKPDVLIVDLFQRFSTRLLQIAYECNLNHRNAKPLSEEEIIIGTITQKTPQPRMRKEKISKLRESTDVLVRQVREALEGDESKPVKRYLRDAWDAWNLSMTESAKGKFGAGGFGWVALGALLNAMVTLEETENVPSSS
ncbi:RNA-dependent RNA polymerase [Agaricus bisporus var. bisporus H97]|uniref:RNA-dependent RNA polymerase n=1 Tax=Agaricus bisporus var. bisporus (strain H97 / ATCC MYA-4626 / FGSC 10389) TaxID=936046 RepID=UPI00029F77B4|nr:RNA-dependent RNA polymerase [Agaricus bisporus var. bisporus H97]EKV47657.1 RNA-dependent RNA polymerase [Agaricus bisporus var. bisporus H97]